MCENVDLENQATTKNYKCKFCNSLFTHKRYCTTHERYCAHNHSRSSCMFSCPNCKATYSRKDNMKAHLKKCTLNKTENPKKTRTPCLVEECDLEFYLKSTLINHLRSSHQDIFVKEEVIKTFQTFEEFLQWKESEEESTFSYFSQKSGKKKTSTYYYCQHDGSAKVHSERTTSKRVKKGRVKVGNFCIAKMKVWEDINKSICVHYFPTHSHRCNPEDVVHKPLPQSISTFINQQISEEVSPSKIFHKITEGYVHRNDVNNLKLNLLTKKVIRERARRRRMALKLNKDDPKDVNLLPQQMVEKGSDDFYSLNDDSGQSSVNEIVQTTENSPTDKNFNSITSRMESNISLINNFIASAKQKKVEEHMLSHVDSVLSDLVLYLQNHETDTNCLTQVEPIRLTLKYHSQEKFNTQLPQLPAFKRLNDKRTPQPKPAEKKKSVVKRKKSAGLQMKSILDKTTSPKELESYDIVPELIDNVEVVFDEGGRCYSGDIDPMPELIDHIEVVFDEGGRCYSGDIGE